MTITFHIDYHTEWGESLGVILNENEIAMLSTVDGNHWQGDIEFRTIKSPFAYRYGIFNQGQCTRCEASEHPHQLPLRFNRQSVKHAVIHDAWSDGHGASYLFSDALSGSHTVEGDKSLAVMARTVVFRAVAPCLHKEGRTLHLIGSSDMLGRWQTDLSLPMTEVAPNVWVAMVKESWIDYPLEYKFIALNPQGEVEWEQHPNRTLSVSETNGHTAVILPETEVTFDSSFRRMAGTAVPIFSLRSEHSCGVGDFGDLKLLIDWAVATHQQAIQILPINDTTISHTWTDSYPYNSISIYAIHPMYLDLTQLGGLKGVRHAQQFERRRRKLNALAAVDYEAVNKAKMEYARSIYEQTGRALLRTEEFKKFLAENAHWLKPYAAFCLLRDRYGTADFRSWERCSVYDAEEIDALCSPSQEDYTEIAFHYYIQYNLHIQLLAVSAYAREQGVILKGDIPIGISRNSVEAWTEPHYFNLNGQAGAPPDDFSKNGQNWGFPTYNWEAMERDGYQWWLRRFRKMATYFTAYRIDHILGFFRIWEIPQHAVHGLLGQFSPALPMTVAEIESYGLHFQREFMTEPFINDALLLQRFGEVGAAVVKEQFVVHRHHDIYAMRPEFDTQRKVEAWFADKQDEESIALRDGLYDLLSNVLFVPDRTNDATYHPRISALEDYTFQRLTTAEQEAFTRLYNDYFYRRHHEFWYREAMKKLPRLIRSTRMLVCGEDLGMVPDCVPWVMEKLQILSLEIQRMPKKIGETFGTIDNYPYLSVCTFSSHDTSTLRGWWKEDVALTQRYATEVLGLMGPVMTDAPGWICKEILYRHLRSRSMLCILTLQDWLSMDDELRCADVEGERINVPANPRHYWRYRMHLTLEALLAATSFNKQVRALVSETDRWHY